MGKKELYSTFSIMFIFGILIGFMIPSIYSQSIFPQDLISSNDISGLFNISTDRYSIMIQNADAYHIYSCKNTDSMIPSIGYNTTIIVKSVDSISDISIGDIVIFKYNERIIVHRVTEIENDTQGEFLVTKGDNNFFNDFYKFGKIRINQVIGIVIGIIY